MCVSLSLSDRPPPLSPRIRTATCGTNNFCAPTREVGIGSLPDHFDTFRTSQESSAGFQSRFCRGTFLPQQGTGTAYTLMHAFAFMQENN